MEHDEMYYWVCPLQLSSRAILYQIRVILTIATIYGIVHGDKFK